MKRIKVTSVVLAAAMCVSMVMTPVGVMADDRPAPSETQNAEVAEKQTPKETEKQKTVETEEQKPTEAQKQEPEGAEEKKPAETEKHETEQTEEQKPAENEKQNSEQTEEKKPVETEKQEPEGTDDKSDETEKNGTQDSGNVENDIAKESKEAKGSASKDIPSETATQTPKEASSYGTITNAKVTDGVLTWDKFNGASYYDIVVFGCQVYCGDNTSCEINSKIDQLIKKGKIKKGSTYKIYISAVDDEDEILAKTSYQYAYESSATPDPVVTITNVNVTNGVLTWDKYTGASYYEITIYGNTYGGSFTVYGTSFELNNKIDWLIKKGKINKVSTYKLEITAFNNDDEDLSTLNYTYAYESTSTPDSLGTISNVRINGDVLKWNNYNGADHYGLEIAELSVQSWLENECELDEINYCIDRYIKSGKIKKNNSYTIEIYAYDDENYKIATANYVYSYASQATVIKIGTIPNVKINKGILTWGNYKGATSYHLLICTPELLKEAYDDESYWRPLSDDSYDVEEEIECLIRSGFIEKGSSYVIMIEAQDDDGNVLANKVINTYTLSISTKKAAVNYKKLRKKNKTVTRAKVMTLNNAQGKLTYKLISVKSKKYKKYFKINTTTGNVTIKKKLKKGTYTVKVRVSASGNENYNPVTKDVSFKIKVK